MLCDLNECVESILVQFKPELELLDIDLELDLSHEPVLVKGSKVRFEQITSNLLKNAIQACEKTAAPKITLKTSIDSEHCLLSIQDNGKGVPPEIMGQLFDPFFTTKNVGEGVGLGLALCYAIADEANGKISCKNIAEGGVCFDVVFPSQQVQNDSRSQDDVKELVDG